MPLHIAIDLDSREVRAVVASSKAGQLYLEQAFALNLVEQAEGEKHEAADAGDVKGWAAKLAAAFAARGIRRGEAMALVGRSSVELKQLSLPPAPDGELPDLVRFQAQREFNNISPDWPLDFIPLDQDPTQSRSVLAGALPPEAAERLNRLCQPAGLTLNRLVLRPCASASLWRRKHPPTSDDQVRLLVDMLAAEVDLTVAVGPRVIFTRNARLPGHFLSTPEEVRPLISEIKRTIAAVQNQLGGRKVEEISLVGSGWGHVQLVERIKTDLELPAKLLDPFSGFSASPEVEKANLEHPGRFAALLGLLADEVSGTAPEFDFLHPRKAPPPPNHNRRMTVLAAAAGLLLVAVGGSYWMKLSNLQTELDSKRNLSKQIVKQQAQFSAYVEAASAIDDWLAGDVVWLDELAEFSKNTPPSPEVLITRFTANGAKQGGLVTLQGAAQARSVVGKMEQNIRHEQRQVLSGLVQEDDQFPKYPQQFKATIQISQQTPEDYRARLAPPPVSPKPEPSKTDNKTASTKTAAANTTAQDSKTSK